MLKYVRPSDVGIVPEWRLYWKSYPEVIECGEDKLGKPQLIRSNLQLH
jgi:hypothetical protein